MKGFKDKSGKFRPTENKIGVRKSRDQTIKIQGVRLSRTTPLGNITVERLRFFNDDETLVVQYIDKNNKKWFVADIWAELESQKYNNDTERNQWLKQMFGKQWELRPKEEWD